MKKSELVRKCLEEIGVDATVKDVIKHAQTKGYSGWHPLSIMDAKNRGSLVSKIRTSMRMKAAKNVKPTVPPEKTPSPSKPLIEWAPMKTRNGESIEELTEQVEAKDTAIAELQKQRKALAERLADKCNKLMSTLAKLDIETETPVWIPPREEDE